MAFFNKSRAKKNVFSLTNPFQLSYSTRSRQIAVFGLESMGKLVQMDVLIIGMKGLGVEIGKFSSSFVYLLVSSFLLIVELFLPFHL